MEKLNCQTCGKELKETDPVFGSSGNFFCADCFKFSLNELKTPKKDFYHNRKKWNEHAKKSNEHLMSKVKGSNYYN